MEVKMECDLEVKPAQSARPEDFTALCRLINRSQTEVTINLLPLSSPSLALEIQMSDGNPVRLPPPPVPGGPIEKATLQPDQSHSVEFSGFLPAWTPAGDYRVRLSYRCQSTEEFEFWSGDLISGWCDFRLQKKPG